MNFLTKTMRSNSGQALLIGALLVLTLLITIPTLAMFSNHLSHAAVKSLNAHKGTQAAEAGVAQAMWLLGSSTTTWQRAFNDPLTLYPELAMDGSTIFEWSDSTNFTLQAGIAPEPYEIQVTVQALDKNRQAVRAETAIISRKMLGIQLPTRETAVAALAYFGPTLLSLPTQLQVDYGPIINFSNDTTIASPDSHYPRKYGLRSIAPYTTSPSAPTDGNQYWAFAALGECPEILTSYYIQQAQNTSILDSLGNPTSGYITTTQTFPDGYTMPVSTNVIYETNSLTLGRVGIDVSQGALIVGSSLTLNNTSGNTGLLNPNGMTLAVPPTAKMEYPTQPSSNLPYQAMSQVSACAPGGLYCPVTALLPSGTNPDIHGFVYVKGNLDVQNGNWTLIGQLRVDGTITISAGATLHIIEDDLIAHNVTTDRLVLVTDRVYPVTPENTTFSSNPPVITVFAGP